MMPAARGLTSGFMGDINEQFIPSMKSYGATQIDGTHMPTEICSNNASADGGRRSVAERMRAYRRRRKRNLRCVRLVIGRAEFDGLVAKGYLAPGAREDLDAIRLAVDDLIFDWLHGGYNNLSYA